VSKRHKFQALTWQERLLLFQAALMLPVTALGLRILDVKRWQQTLARMSRDGKNAAHKIPDAIVNKNREAESVAPQIPHSKSAQSFEASSLDSSNELKSRVEETQLAKDIARLVRAAANHGLYRANCLEQSIVLWWFLRRKGIESEIRFGARKAEDQLHAHAWVECLGAALNEDRGVEERYSPFSATTVSSKYSVDSGRL
jgi:hypothetical protein